MLFADTDVRGSEDKSAVSASVRAEGGDNTHNYTVMVIPLTVAQYQAEPYTYGNSCNSIIAATSLDTAEGE